MVVSPSAGSTPPPGAAIGVAPLAIAEPPSPTVPPRLTISPAEIPSNAPRPLKTPEAGPLDEVTLPVLSRLNYSRLVSLGIVTAGAVPRAFRTAPIPGWNVTDDTMAAISCTVQHQAPLAPGRRQAGIAAAETEAAAAGEPTAGSTARPRRDGRGDRRACRHRRGGRGTPRAAGGRRSDGSRRCRLLADWRTTCHRDPVRRQRRRS